MAELYDKPGTASVNLAWATTRSGTVEWPGAKRAGGFYDGEPVPAEELNYRWNILGEFIQFTEAASQRRFNTLTSAVQTVSEGTPFWIDYGYNEPFSLSWEEQSLYYQEGVIRDCSTDSENVYYCLGDKVAGMDASTGDSLVNTDSSYYTYEFAGDTVTSVHTDGNALWATTGEGGFYKLDRENSTVSAQLSTVISGSVNRFKSNGTHGIACDAWTNTSIGATGNKIYIVEDLDTTPSLVVEIETDPALYMSGVAISDTLGFACSTLDSVNVTAVELSTGSIEWQTVVGTAAICTSICTDNVRVYVTHTTGYGYNVTCLGAIDGAELWTSNADGLLDSEGMDWDKRCFVDEKYVYIATDVQEARTNGVYVLDKFTGIIVDTYSSGSVLFCDSDAYCLFAWDIQDKSISSYLIGGAPKQFIRVSGTEPNRSPFHKLAVPI